MQSGQAHALKYKSALDGIITIVRQEGVAGLYRGIESKLVQSVLTAAILFAGQRRIYEATKAVSRHSMRGLTEFRGYAESSVHSNLFVPMLHPRLSPKQRSRSDWYNGSHSINERKSQYQYFP